MIKFSEMREFGEPYVVAEVAANHNGDMDIARKLIEKAKECGASCVKFQSFTKDSVFSKMVYNENRFLNDDYRNRTDYTMEEIIDAYHIDYEKHKMLKEYCDKYDIEFASTPFSRGEVDMLVDDFDVPFIKVASMDVDNIPFLKYIASKGKPVVISAGLFGLDDISLAIDCLKENGCPQIVLLHCVSLYPPKDNQVNLNNIDMLRMAFGLPTGYSDHTLGPLATMLSVSKGVCLIEKHFTLDKNMEGWDHKVSADPNDLKMICEASRRGYVMLGHNEKRIVEDKERRDAFKRSIVAAHPLKKGDIIKEEDLNYKRPGTGISPKYYQFLIGKELKRDMDYDELFTMYDF